MALFYECRPQCAQKELDTADIVREAMFRQSTLGADEATALVITDTQQAGLQPPKYAFAPQNKIPPKIVTRVDPAPPPSTYR